MSSLRCSTFERFCKVERAKRRMSPNPPPRKPRRAQSPVNQALPRVGASVYEPFNSLPPTPRRFSTDLEFPTGWSGLWSKPSDNRGRPSCTSTGRPRCSSKTARSTRYAPASWSRSSSLLKVGRSLALALTFGDTGRISPTDSCGLSRTATAQRRLMRCIMPSLRIQCLRPAPV
jgi:hypothetical protein